MSSRPSRSARALATSRSAARPRSATTCPRRRRAPVSLRCSSRASSSCCGVEEARLDQHVPQPAPDLHHAAGVAVDAAGPAQSRLVVAGHPAFLGRRSDRVQSFGSAGTAEASRSSAASSSTRSRNSDRTKSRVATSRSAIRRAATSRARYSVSASAPLGPLPVLLERHPVAVRLPVLREQDERGRVGRLQAEDERQQRVVQPPGVELQLDRGERVPDDPDHDEDGHPDDELRGSHEPGEPLRPAAERLRIDLRRGQHGPARLQRGVQARAAPVRAGGDGPQRPAFRGPAQQAGAGVVSHGRSPSPGWAGARRGSRPPPASPRAGGGRGRRRRSRRRRAGLRRP